MPGQFRNSRAREKKLDSVKTNGGLKRIHNLKLNVLYVIQAPVKWFDHNLLYDDSDKYTTIQLNIDVNKQFCKQQCFNLVLLINVP